jgi:protease-4
MNSIYQPWSEAQREKVVAGIERIYELFLQRVVDGRGMTRDEVHKIARGHVWSGKRAKALGLVDEHGGLREALDELRTRAKIAGYVDLELRVLPKKLTLIQLLLRGTGSLITEPLERTVATRERDERGKLPAVLDVALARLPVSILFLPQDQAITIMPGEIVIE